MSCFHANQGGSGGSNNNNSSSSNNNNGNTNGGHGGADGAKSISGNRNGFNGPRVNRESTFSLGGRDRLVMRGEERTRVLRKALVKSDDSNPYEGEAIAKAPLFAELDDTQFIEKLGDAFKPEFDMLRDATGSTVERGSASVIGGYGPSRDKSPSQLLYNGEFYSEVDRTVIGILCMKWILTDEYDTFTAHQAKPIKLSRDDFNTLRQLFFETFKDSAGSYMLIVSMIVNDLGKNEALRENIKGTQKRWEVMNHDEVIYWNAKEGYLELINEFDTQARRRLELGIQFGGMLNIGQLAQAENVPGSLSGIKELLVEDPGAFGMKFLEVVLDVAGAQGHVDSRCSTTWISPVNQAYMNARDCVKAVIEGTKSLHEAYNGILEHRATLLAAGGWKKLRTENPAERATLRLITMARAATPAAAQAMEDCVESLSKEAAQKPVLDFLNQPVKDVQQALIDGLSVDGTADGIAVIPYYAPGLLAEVARVTKTESAQRKTEAIAALLRLIVRAQVGTRPLVNCPDSKVVECDISFVQAQIRSDAFKQNPAILDAVERPERDVYSEDIDDLMRMVYGIRRLQRRRTGSSQHST